MLNEKRVVLMTKMAAYESGEGKRYAEVGTYYRGDYIIIHMLWAVLTGTISYFLIFGLYVLYSLEDFLQNIYKMDIVVYVKNICVWYGIFMVAYLVLTYIVFSMKFRKSRKKQKVFLKNLKRLNAMYREKSK